MEKYELNEKKVQRTMLNDSLYRIFWILIIGAFLFMLSYFTIDPKWDTIRYTYIVILIILLLWYLKSLASYRELIKRDRDLFKNTIVEVWKNKIKIFDSKETHEFLKEDTEIHIHYIYANLESGLAGKGFVLFKSIEEDKSIKVSSLVFHHSFGVQEARRVFKSYPRCFEHKIKIKDDKKAYH